MQGDYKYVSLVATETESTAAAAGAALGGGMITAITGFLGFLLGIIFLVIGLLVGRDKEVVIIRE